MNKIIAEVEKMSLSANAEAIIVCLAHCSYECTVAEFYKEVLPAILDAAKFCKSDFELYRCAIEISKVARNQGWDLVASSYKLVELAAISVDFPDEFIRYIIADNKAEKEAQKRKENLDFWKNDEEHKNYKLSKRQKYFYENMSMSHGLEYSTPEATALYFSGKGRKAALSGNISQMIKAAGLTGFFKYYDCAYNDDNNYLDVIVEAVAKEVIDNGAKISRPKEWIPSLHSCKTEDIFYHFAEYVIGESAYNFKRSDILKFIEKGGLRIKNILHTNGVDKYLSSFDTALFVEQEDKLSNLSSKDYDTLKDFINNKPHLTRFLSGLLSKDTKCNIPEITIKSGNIVMRPVKKNDPLNLFIGNHTACCQKLTGYGESVALVGFNDENSLNYVFEKDGKIWAHTWIVLCKDGSLIMDSIEGNTGPYQDDINKCVVKFADKCKGEVLISDTSYGMTKIVVSHINTRIVATPKMKTAYQYTDSDEESYRIVKTAELRDTYVPKDQRTKFGNKLADVLFNAGL